MVSICIPVYNYDVVSLIRDLHEQATAARIPFEIIVMDDASFPEFQTINRTIDWPEFSYIQLEKNIGRSKIRNALADRASYPYLIFMDCDSAVSSGQYIKNYLPYCRPDIVCYGGRIYEKQKPDDNTYLRWKYGVERESQPASFRQIAPNYGFCSNNFLIDKAVFQRVNFNESLSGYGHEDTFFGLELLGAGIQVEHTDNPLIHLGLEDAEIFLKKTENGIENLTKVNTMLRERYPAFVDHSKLVHTQMLLDKIHLSKFYSMMYRIFKSAFRKNLTGRNPFLFIFDLYRLGYLISLG